MGKSIKINLYLAALPLWPHLKRELKIFENPNIQDPTFFFNKQLLDN